MDFPCCVKFVSSVVSGCSDYYQVGGSGHGTETWDYGMAKHLCSSSESS